MKDGPEGKAGRAAGIGGHPKMAVGAGLETRIEAWEFTGQIVQHRLADGVGGVGGVGGAGKVDGPADQPSGHIFARRAIRLREQWRGSEAQDVAEQLPVSLPRVGCVVDVTGIGLDPADVGDVGVAPHHADEGPGLGLPGEGRQPLHRAVQTPGQRQHGKGHVMLGDHEVVHHRAVRRLEILPARHLSAPVGDPEAHAGRQRLFPDPVGEPQHLAGDRIDLGMGGHASAIGLAVAQGVQARSRHLGRKASFLERQ